MIYLGGVLLILFAMRVRVRLMKQLICNVIVTAIFLFYLLSNFFLDALVIFQCITKRSRKFKRMYCTVQVILCIE